MADDKQYDALRELDQKVLDEVVQEGRQRLDAQLQIATSADQRALTLAGFQITAATASLGGGIALMTADHPQQALAFVAILFALGMLGSAGTALWTVVPRKFKTVGNQPLNWTKDHWRWKEHGFDLRAARVEQAACLEEQIAANQQYFRWTAQWMRISFVVTIGTAVAAAIFLAGVLCSRNSSPVISCAAPATSPAHPQNPPSDARMPPPTLPPPRTPSTPKAALRAR